MNNTHPKLFDIPFDVQITSMTLTSGKVRKYRPLLTEDTGVIPKNVPGYSNDFCIDNARVIYTKKSLLLARYVFKNNSWVLGQ
jgi:hypothetical protein